MRTASDEAPAASGLSEAEAARRLAAEGPNTLPGSERRGLARLVLEVLREPMFALLVGAAAVYLLLGDDREAFVLGVSVAAIIAITVVQERRSERALEALRDLSSPRALVIRDGAARRIAGAGVARGDLLVLAEGDRVPADARLVSVNDLMLDESLLTGESLPVTKGPGESVFSGTLVVRGQARAETAATGPRTEFGRIGASLAALSIERTSLQVETARVVRWFASIGLALCVLLAAWSILRSGDWLAGILSGLTLAMAILPEEFPVVLTVFLALGAWRIARRGVLTRRMPAVETLGAATVLCVDKTGTLTENRMAVAEILADPALTERVVEVAALACELEPFDPMERAIIERASALLEPAGALLEPAGASIERATWTLERDYPLTDAFTAVCHVWRAPDGRRRVALKGAAETVMALSALDAPARAKALEQMEAAARRGLRLLAITEAELDSSVALPDDPGGFAFRWLGFVALADPLRAEVPAAVALCRQAGIRVVMITGDYPGTALAIADAAGIDTAAGAMSGAELAELDAAAVAQAVRRVNVFARIRPEQKLRLVEAFKADGEVVAMTGDGVNDAPALKAAHIGVAMGKRGTDVAREAAALVLVEDDFGSIVDTVRLGRRIYENIRNAMRYILAVHVPTAGMAFLPLMLGLPPFLFPVHIVFLEFVIDPACSIVFEAEDSGAGAMQRPPRDPRARMFDAHMLGVSFALGASALAAVGIAYALMAAAGRPIGELRAFGFASIVFGNLALIHATRSRRLLIWQALAETNPALWWVTAATLSALALVIYLPAAAAVFGFSALAPLDVLMAAASGFAGVLWYEIYKRLQRR